VPCLTQAEAVLEYLRAELTPNAYFKGCAVGSISSWDSFWPAGWADSPRSWKHHFLLPDLPPSDHDSDVLGATVFSSHPPFHRHKVTCDSKKNKVNFCPACLSPVSSYFKFIQLQLDLDQKCCIPREQDRGLIEETFVIIRLTMVN
jgi:hypothetical protein